MASAPGLEHKTPSLLISLIKRGQAKQETLTKQYQIARGDVMRFQMNLHLLIGASEANQTRESGVLETLDATVNLALRKCATAAHEPCLPTSEWQINRMHIK